MYASWGVEMRKISVLLNEDEYALFEKYCDEQGHKKSTLVAKLIRDLLQRERVVSQRPLFVSSEKSSRRTA
jgi:metal-responsive CopG/Arc/MetJ family transcriptional regulator